MYAINETDYEIFYDKNRNDFSVYIGTFSNTNQSFIDVIFYLSLNEQIIKDKTEFFKHLNTFNDLFINNKENIIKDIKKNKLNTINSVLNSYEIEEFLNEHEYNEKQEGYLKEEEYYYFDYEKCDKYIENTYLNEIIRTTEQAKNIKELYEKLQEIKQEIKQDVYNNFFDFTYIETI